MVPAFLVRQYTSEATSAILSKQIWHYMARSTLALVSVRACLFLGRSFRNGLFHIYLFRELKAPLAHRRGLRTWPLMKSICRCSSLFNLAIPSLTSDLSRGRLLATISAIITSRSLNAATLTNQLPISLEIRWLWWVVVFLNHYP